MDCAGGVTGGSAGAKAFIERFNETCRDAVLNAYLFTSVTERRASFPRGLAEHLQRVPAARRLEAPTAGDVPAESEA